MTPRLRSVIGPLASILLLAPAASAQSEEPPPGPTVLQPAPTATTTAPPVVAPPATHGSIVEFSSLRLMRDKGVITQAEYDSAMADIAPSTGARAADATSLVVGKWSTTIYGFAETDLINDSTQSFNDVAGNALVLRPNGIPYVPAAGVAPPPQNTYPANHGRTQMSVRNSRLGLQLRAPETHHVRVSGMVETDFLGYEPAPSATTGPTESQFFTSPTLRLRHAVLKVETPVVDILIGQYWDLFGWQSVYQPNSVQIQGLVGELYARDPQIRLSHTWKTHAIEVEVALAARRPPSRDSQMPEGQGGVRLAFPWWTGIMTNGATATNVMPASIAVTGDVRQFSLPEFSQTPTRTVSLTTQAIAVDAFIPVIPKKRANEGNALSLNGEIVTGSGISDLYTGLSYGLTFPYLPNTSSVENGNTGTNYTQDVDNGMVIYDTAGALHGIQLTSFLAGLQYYLPGLGGHVWVSGNFARTQSGNIATFTRPITVGTDSTKVQYAFDYTVRQAENFFDANLFWDIVSGARVGFEYANFNDQYVDGAHAINNRFQFSGFFIF